MRDCCTSIDNAQQTATRKRRRINAFRLQTTNGNELRADSGAANPVDHSMVGTSKKARLSGGLFVFA
jgi:hypothetical protein